MVTVPATPAPRLLAPLTVDAARELGKIAYASMAIVSLALPRHGLPKLPGSGFLVPPVDGRAVKAWTFTTHKWGWVADLAPDLFILRASLRRIGEEALLQRSDLDLVRSSLPTSLRLSGLSCRAPSKVTSNDGVVLCHAVPSVIVKGSPASGRPHPRYRALRWRVPRTAGSAYRRASPLGSKLLRRS